MFSTSIHVFDFDFYIFDFKFPVFDFDFYIFDFKFEIFDFDCNNIRLRVKYYSSYLCPQRNAVAGLYLNLGLVFYNLNNQEKCILYRKKALDIARDQNLEHYIISATPISIDVSTHFMTHSHNTHQPLPTI